MEDVIRRVRFTPYRKGMGPRFSLTLWDTGHYHYNGPQWCVGYRLRMHENGKTTTLFEGEDFGCSPLHSIDSDDCVRSLMEFLTLRPGDTDAEYFEDYTKEQIEYCDQYAEALGYEVYCRFGED